MQTCSPISIIRIEEELLLRKNKEGRVALYNSALTFLNQADVN